MVKGNTIDSCTAIIPARGGSKSITRKNVVDFCGKPMIAWTIEQALGSKYISEVYVTTDDSEIADISRQYGAKIIQRPGNLATDASASEEALSHAIREIEKDKKIDVVVFLQATSPVREKEDVDMAVEKFFSERADSLFSAAILDDFCAWKIIDNKLKSATFDYKNRGRRQDRKPYYLENGSIYVTKPEIIKQYNNRLGGKIVFYLMPLWKSYEIDSLEDLELCSYFMRKMLRSGPKIDMEDIELIAYDFDGIMTDNKVIVSDDGREAVVANRADGLAISSIKEMGIAQVIISTESNKVVAARARKIGVPVLYNIVDKKECLVEYCRTNNYDINKTIYIGNDINDLEIMKMVRIAICPLDANDAVKEVSKYILSAKGGEGLIREFMDLILDKSR